MKILLADDSATPRMLLSRALDKLGHECAIAEDGLAACQMLEQVQPDVIISDWTMPGIDGPELCRRLRGDASGRYVYFIMLTSLDDRGSIVEGLEAGADDYLVKSFGQDELEARLIAAARVTALHRRLASQQAELERLNVSLFQSARTDHLTGAGNRLRQDEDLEVLLARLQRYGHGFCVALFDVDYFKQYNDTEGHLAGDSILRAVADSFATKSRDVDTVYRYGGEELLIVFPEQEINQAGFAAERMRHEIELLAIPHPRGIVTVSAGVAAADVSDADDVGRLLARADAALYRAKREGRNRVKVQRAGAAQTSG
jgi:two-component system cell cycle response regulator